MHCDSWDSSDRALFGFLYSYVLPWSAKVEALETALPTQNEEVHYDRPISLYSVPKWKP